MSALTLPNISKKDMKIMKVQRNNHNVKSIRKRLNVLWLTSIIDNAADIAEIAGVSKRTVFEVINLYNKYDLNAVMEINYRKPQSDLMGYAELIASEFESNPPRSIKEARGIIKQITGIKRSLTQTREFLYKLGMKLLKPIKVPMGTNETSLQEKTANQKEFVKNKLSPLLIEAKEGKRKLLFMDASHMQLACVVGFIWCFVTKYISALPVRGRVNVLGAVSPYGNDLVYDVSQDSIDQYSIAFFILKIRNKFKEDKITIVLDNAGYHKTPHVIETAEKLGIELLFLPVASPNLNIIERLWKLAKKMFLHNDVFTSLDELEKHLKNSMGTLKKKHKKEIRTLLTSNFQYFDGTVQFVTA